MVEKAEKFLNFYSFYKLHKKLKDENEQQKMMIMLNLYTLLPNIPEKYYIKSRIAKINLLSSFAQDNKSIKIADIIKDAILKNYHEIKSITTNFLEKYKDKIDSIEEKVNEINIKRSSIAQQPTNDKVTITILVINRIIKQYNSHLIFPIEISINKKISYVDFCMKVIDIFQSILYTPKINYTELDNIIHIYKAKQNLNKTEMNLILFNAIFLFVSDINLVINTNYFSLENKKTFTLNQDDCFIIDIFKNQVNISTDYNEKVLPYYYKVCNLNCEYFAPLTNSILEPYQDMFYFLSSENKLQMLMRDEKGLQYNNRRIKIPKLRNLGNICYFNSGLQCILNCTFFTKYFEDNYVSKDCLNVNFEQLPLTKALSYFITTLQYNNQPSVNYLYTTFIKKENKYADHSQHDSGEFISDFLTALDVELNRSSNYKEAAISEDNYLKSIQKYTNKNNSIIFDLFYGRVENIYKCDCKPNKCKCMDKKVNEFFLLFHVNIKVATKSFDAYLVDWNNKFQKKEFSLPLPKTINIYNIYIYNIWNDEKNGLYEGPMNYFICKVSKKTNTVTVITNPTEIIKDEDVNDYVIYIYQKLPVGEKMFFHFIIVPTVIKEKRNWLKKAKDIYVPRDNTVNLDIKLYSHPFQIILPKDTCDLTSSWTGQYPNKLTARDFLKKVLAKLRPSMKIKDINSISKSYSPFSLSVIFDYDFLPLFLNLENYINEDTAPFDLGLSDNNISVQVSTPTQGQKLSLEDCLLINSKYMNSSSKCKCNHKTQMSIKITKLPLILIISLKKAKINEYKGEVKLNNDVLYQKELNMFAYVNQDIIKKEECDYELIGSVIHKGSTQCGHYSSIIKTEDGWILCNDDKLYIANDYYNNSSTILFYRKKVN